MKTLLILSIALFSWTASAESIIAKYSYGIEQGFNSSKIVTATLAEDGELAISVTTSKSPMLDDDSSEESVIAKISEKNLRDLSDKIRRSMHFKVVTRRFDIICMMMPSAASLSNHLYLSRSYDELTQEFVGDVELVTGPQGCWVRTKVNFEGEYARSVSADIKSQLRVLVNEYAGDLL